MGDVDRAILDAWQSIAPQLIAHPALLRKRLARRQHQLFKMPPRAWCLAVRASDLRLYEFGITRRPRRGGLALEEEVTLDADHLRRLCAPVILTAPGETLGEVAERLGVSRAGLLNARVEKIFHTHHVAGLGNYWGRPRALLYTTDQLDPATKNFRAPDPAWTWTAAELPYRIPDDLRPQALVRVPRMESRVPRRLYLDLDALHPEHPAVDPPPRRRKSLKLPPPEPDYVWYKWKGDQYLGYDWRNPLAKKNYERHQRQLAKQSAARKLRRLTHPPPQYAVGSLGFRGWRWLCPHCRRAVNVLFLPLDPINLLHDAPQRRPDANLPVLATLVKDHPVRVGRIAGFACEKCHRVRRFSPADPNAWNEMITYLTGGLLFGREVPRPPNLLAKQRRIAYTPRPNRDPSQRRPQIERLLLTGHPFKQIAQALNLAYGTVLWYAQQVYKQHGVRSLPDLLRKHGQTPKLKEREEVRRRLAEEQSVAQIAREMGISASCVYNHLYMLRRARIVAAKARKRGQSSEMPAVAATVGSSDHVGHAALHRESVAAESSRSTGRRRGSSDTMK